MLQRMLTPDDVARIQLGIAEARRFPDFASAVGRMARERAREPVVRLLSEAAASGQLSNARLRHRRNISLISLSSPWCGAPCLEKI
jgi:hypothetical protein